MPLTLPTTDLVKVLLGMGLRSAELEAANIADYGTARGQRILTITGGSPILALANTFTQAA